MLLSILALAGSAFAVTGLFYSTTNCNPITAFAACSNVPTNGCCKSGLTLAWAVKLSNLYGGITLATDSSCETIIGHEDSPCLSTGTQNIAGVTWVYIRKREIINSSDSSIHNSTCHNADIYYLALSGVHRKPFSITVVEYLNQANAIDWSTHTFWTDKLHVARDIIAEHGDGLDENQIAAISAWRT